MCKGSKFAMRNTALGKDKLNDSLHLSPVLNQKLLKLVQLLITLGRGKCLTYSGRWHYGRCQNLLLGLKRSSVPTFWPQSTYIEIFKTEMLYIKLFVVRKCISSFFAQNVSNLNALFSKTYFQVYQY